MKLTKAQIKGKQEELGRAQAPAALGGGAVLPPGVGRCYPPTSTLQPPGVFRPRPPGGLQPRSRNFGMVRDAMITQPRIPRAFPCHEFLRGF